MYTIACLISGILSAVVSFSLVYLLVDESAMKKNMFYFIYVVLVLFVDVIMWKRIKPDIFVGISTGLIAGMVFAVTKKSK